MTSSLLTTRPPLLGVIRLSLFSSDIVFGFLPFSYLCDGKCSSVNCQLLLRRSEEWKEKKDETFSLDSVLRSPSRIKDRNWLFQFWFEGWRKQMKMRKLVFTIFVVFLFLNWSDSQPVEKRFSIEDLSKFLNMILFFLLLLICCYCCCCCCCCCCCYCFS
jgi:hypothetical protein